MIALIIAQTSLKLDHVGSKTRSLGQIIRKACKHSRGNILCQIFMKLCQNDCLEDRSDKFESGNLHKTLSDYIYLDLRKTSGDKTLQHLGQFDLVSELRPTMGLLFRIIQEKQKPSILFQYYIEYHKVPFKCIK